MITKKYLKTRQATKVTFRVDFAKKAQKAEIAGEFNNWQPQPLKRLKSGDFKIDLELRPGRSYQFRYRIDGAWENDRSADRYIPNGLGEDNSVVDC